MPFRRYVRSTRHLASTVAVRLRESRIEVPADELEVIVRSVLHVGVRRGRAELARAIVERIGIGEDLGELVTPHMTVEPNLGRLGPRRAPPELVEPAAPHHVRREIVTRTRSGFRKP
jgi:hypothetical protein